MNGKGEPSCILLTEKTTVNKFKDVPTEIALAEGEGDMSLAHWKRVHTDLYAPYLSMWGIKNIEDATVITEFFKIVYK